MRGREDDHERPETIRRFLAGQQEAETASWPSWSRSLRQSAGRLPPPHADSRGKLLEALGLTVERHPVPEDLVRGQWHASPRPTWSSAGASATDRPSRSTPTATSCRPAKGWSHDPYGAEIEDGWMYGRGVAVSKSDFATYAFALLALDAAAAAGAALAGTVELHLTYDEEIGGEIGPRWLLEAGISKPDLAIGAGFSYAVVTAHNGCLHLEVRSTAARPTPPCRDRRRRPGSGERNPLGALRLAKGGRARSRRSPVSAARS